MTTMQIRVPDIGDFSDVAIIEVLVAVGETIRPEQSLITVESDKASIEIPASHGGVVKSIAVKLGDKISQGAVILEVESAEAASPVATAPASAATTLAPALLSVATAPPAAAPPATSAQVVELRMPNIGDFKDVAVIEVLVAAGQTIAAEQSLITVESDKASMEIPASHAGVLQSLAVKLGDKINIGDLIGTVLLSGAAALADSAAPAAPAAAAVAPPPQPTPSAAEVASPAVPSSAALPHASPSVRKFARELGVPLSQVAGSGEKGRITQSDVQAFTRSVMQVATQVGAAQAGSTAQNANFMPENVLQVAPAPKVDFSKFGATERKALSRIQKLSGANLHRNWVRIPHVTNHDDADITELEALRVQLNSENAKAGVKVTMLAFLIKACVAALQKFPQFNASLDGEELVLKKYFHIGFAADTPNGLVVPVIKDADQKGILQISRELAELSAKAREGKLSPAEMQGACFTISSLGGIGGTYFTPIINAPEVAILGVCRSAMRPVWDGAAFAPRLILPLSLSWDHRVIDGAAAAKFNAYLGQVLADFRRVML
jgi:pyruvate dehydrogenase E2 component (dihydrolipoamide acetyltransferase)